MRIGIIGDPHIPFDHPMYLAFCQDTFERYRVDWIHCTGDACDHHAISFWEHNPNGMSAGAEMDATTAGIERYQSAYPELSICIGNHDERQFRVARKNGLPDRYLKSYRDVWNTPKWNWDFAHTFDGVLYEHGTGSSGKEAALNLAIQKRTSMVIGHVHSWGGVKWHANPYNIIFGLNAGCGIDCTSYACEYGKDFAVRPVLGCGIVIDGEQAHFEVMRCAPGERYARKQAKKSILSKLRRAA